MRKHGILLTQIRALRAGYLATMKVARTNASHELMRSLFYWIRGLRHELTPPTNPINQFFQIVRRQSVRDR